MSKKSTFYTLILFSTYFLFATFAHSVEKTSLKLCSFPNLPGWYKKDIRNATTVLKKSCARIVESHYHPGDPRSEPLWHKACSKILSTSTSATNIEIKSTIEKYFTPRLVLFNHQDKGLFTGYYEPTIKGSLYPTKYFKIPLYGHPYHLTVLNGGKYRIRTHGKLQKLPTRKEISEGPIYKGAPILAWVHSKIDRFFLQVQGSGEITLPSGKKLLLGYNSQNGYHYYAIGRYLLKNHFISKKKMSMQSIRAWLESHPKDVDKVLNLNPSFVFFRKLHAIEPIGAEEVPLTPWVSLAVDNKYIPLGTPIWLDTKIPVKNKAPKPWQGMVVAQDIGGAIKGPIRGDIFFGDAPQAAWLAGNMKQQGRYWLLLPKGLEMPPLS